MAAPHFDDDDLDNENEKGDKLPPIPDPLLEKLKAYILHHYEPVQSRAEADLSMSTREIFQAIQLLYPDPFFTEGMLARWLHDQGFTFYDAGKLRFEWLLKSV